MKDASFGIVPILREGQTSLFLLIQHQGGHWGFPKGHAELGESALEAACREFEEETGIVDYQLLGEKLFVENYVFTKDKQSVNKTVTYFLALVKSKAVKFQEAEIQAYEWADFEQAIALITFEGSKQVLRQVNQYLSETSD